MNYISLEEATELHDFMIDEIGGKTGANSVSLGYLGGVLANIQNDDYYPTLIEKLAHLIFSCVKFHTFLDGNKRSAIYLGIYFLELNNIKYDTAKFVESLEDVVVQIAEDSVSKECLQEILAINLYHT